jgi:RHS repeat-associated protein
LDEIIFSKKEIEASPFDRVLEQRQIDTAWSNKPVKFGYEANENGEVKKYIATFDYGSFSSAITLSSTLYGAGQLSKNTVTDEDGNKTIEFKNGQGQVLLVRKMLDATTGADTYYVYNDYNQLAYVLSPKAVQQISQANNTITDVVVNELCYQYRYDARSRLVEKKLPGKDWEWMVYDKQDRLVLTQDGMLRTASNTFSTRGWMFTKYDYNNRIVLTGFYPNSESRTAVQEYLNNLPATSLNTLNNEIRLINPVVISGMNVYYRNQAYPSTETILLGINYYDTYPPEAPAIPATVLGQYTLAQATGADNDASTNSLPTASYVRNIEDTNWTKNYTYYDTMGRAVSTHSINHLGGYTKTETELDFAGVPQKTNTYHLRKSGEIGITVQERFVYDSQNRLKQHFHQVDSNPEQLLAENTYNELSQLSNKKVGSSGGSAPLQNIDYAYNIRGWMTHINKDQMQLPDMGGRLFSYRIRYNEKEGLTNPDPVLFPGKDVLPKYNGNIAEVDWRSVENIGNNPSVTPKRYGYAYDKLNRLTAGYYQNPNNPNSKENTESLGYDLNGNITRLYRTSVTEYGSTIPTKIDDLEYMYAAQNKSNRLIYINDLSGNATGYEGGGQEIKYDVNGNMTEMPDKGISTIKYNYLNLPNQLKMQASIENITIDSRYRADGVKLRKQNTTITSGLMGDIVNIKITDYLDGFQYLSSGNPPAPPGGGGSESLMANSESARAFERQAYSIDNGPVALTPMTLKNTDLQFFPTAEGFYDYKKDQYIYQYEDHLGNARVSFGRNSAGALEITDANDYYPFGMNHLKTGSAIFGQGSYKNYKYQEQELQETGFYSFKWRNYMPDLGRFFNIDPLSEKYSFQSHYNFSENRVIDARELEGLEAVLINDTTIEWRVKVNNNLGSDYSKTLLQDAADVLSQNGLTVKIIEDPKALFTINLEQPKSKFTEDGIVTINGFNVPDGNIYDGEVTSKNSPRTLAHELGHKAGLPHIFDATSKVENTKENQKNLMNSDDNNKAELRDTAGTNLVPSQTTDIKNHIKITNENRERKEKEQQKLNQIPNQNGN